MRTAMADTLSSHHHKWSFGLSGLPATLANLTAVAVVMVMFWNSQNHAEEQAKYDRQMFRDELKVIHGDSERKWEVIRQNQQALITIGNDTKSAGKSMEELTNAIKTLTEETKKLKDATNKNTDKPPSKP